MEEKRKNMGTENEDPSGKERGINIENEGEGEGKEIETEKESNNFESLVSSLETKILLIDAVKGEYSYLMKHEALDFVALLEEVGPVESEEAKSVVKKILDKLESLIDFYQPRDDLDKDAKEESLDRVRQLKDI